MVRMLPRIIHFLGYDPYPEPQSFAQELVARWRRLDLSQKRMAVRLGIDEGTLAKWEKGTVDPAGKQLQIVEEYFTSKPESFAGR